MNTIGIIIYPNGQMEKLKKSQLSNGKSAINGIAKSEIEDYFGLPFEMVVPSYAIDKGMLTNSMRILEADVDIYTNPIATLLIGYRMITGTVVLVKINEYCEINTLNKDDIESIYKLDKIVNGGI